MALCVECDRAVLSDLAARKERDAKEATERRMKHSGLGADYASGERTLGDIPMSRADIVTALQMVGSSIRGLYLVGPAKAYKTTVAAAFLASQIRGGADGKYVFVPDLMEDIIASYKRDDGSRQEILDRYATAPCLVLDDLGKEKASDHSAKALMLILDYRWRNYRKGQWLIVTSQFGYDGLVERFPTEEDADAIKHRLTNLTVSVPMAAA